MDWTAAIERNREALKRVLAGLIAMAGLAAGMDRAGALPRHVHRAVLRLLRPAEAAARRLVIVAARGLHQSLPASRPRPPRPGRPRGLPVSHGFRLFDPPSRFGRRRQRQPLSLPRISLPGLTALPPLPAPLTPFDPIDAAPLARRLATLAVTLDDLPRQAKRFARWQARLDAARSYPPLCGEGRSEAEAHRRITSRGGDTARQAPHRVWPLRPGRPPGRHSPRDRQPAHEVHAVLDTVHGLALWALDPPDTS